jgi:hypothetical protein
MSRRYYKEPDVTHGRPKTKIDDKPPPFFKFYETTKWDVRRFLRELVRRQAALDWEQKRADWEASGGGALTPLLDPDEINEFLCRPRAVSRIQSAEEAEHALRLGMILIAVDPNYAGPCETAGNGSKKNSGGAPATNQEAPREAK